MKYSIGIFLGQTDLYKEELTNFSSLKDLDNFTMKCINREDVVAKFVDLVSSFLVDHRKVIKNIENRTGKKHNGRITAYYYDNDEIKYIKILYKGFNLLDYDDFAKILREELIEKLKEIRSYAFAGCTNLAEIIIPESVEVVGYSVFNNCSIINSRASLCVGAACSNLYFSPFTL